MALYTLVCHLICQSRRSDCSKIPITANGNRRRRGTRRLTCSPQLGPHEFLTFQYLYKFQNSLFIEVNIESRTRRPSALAAVLSPTTILQAKTKKEGSSYLRPSASPKPTSSTPWSSLSPQSSAACVTDGCMCRHAYGHAYGQMYQTRV